MVDDLRCSTQARAMATAPVGTAVAAEAFLLVALPRPWPRDVGEHPVVAALADVARTAGARVQAVVPAGETQPDRTVTAVYELGDGPFRGYTRSGPGEVAGDVLVCTHGSRDRCCGSLGTALALALAPGDSAKVGSDKLNLRSEPSVDGDIVAELEPGTQVAVTGEAIEADSHTWYPIEVVETGKTGFVAAGFLVPAGD